MTSVMAGQRRWTVADLEGLPENGDRYEIIDGDLFVTRAPHWDHQDIAGAIYAELRAWSQVSGLGKAGFGPGVVFSPTDAVIPDVVWTSNERLAQALDSSGHLTLAPELVVEVLSQSEQDQRRDSKTKLTLYSQRGVAEYWIVDRDRRVIEIYRRQESGLQLTQTLEETAQLTSPLLPGFSYLVQSVFA